MMESEERHVVGERKQVVPRLQAKELGDRVMDPGGCGVRSKWGNTLRTKGTKEEEV